MAVRLAGRTAIKSGSAEGEKMKKTTNIPQISPRALPVVIFRGKQYFADLKLNEFRPVQELLESIPFDGEEGRIMCRNTGIVTCKSCRMSFLISMAYEEEILRCMRCFNLLKSSSSE